VQKNKAAKFGTELRFKVPEQYPEVHAYYEADKEHYVDLAAIKYCNEVFISNESRDIWKPIIKHQTPGPALYDIPSTLVIKSGG